MKVVLIDNRELLKSINRYKRRLAALGDYKFVVARLETGDFVVPPDLAVERKDVNDLLSSISDGRLFKQVARMTEAFRVPVLLVEGDLAKSSSGKVIADRRRTGWDWYSVQRALWKVQSMGCIVVRASHGEAATALHNVIDWASRLDIQKVVGLHVEQAVDDDGLRLLMSIPFIGAKTAVKLVEYAGSPAWALVALTDLHQDVKTPGVSRRRRLEARRILGLNSDEYLMVLKEEDDG